MANEVKLTREEEATFDRIEKALSRPEGRAMTATADEFDAGNACDIFRKIRDEILLVIKFLKKLPFSWAKRIADILEFLMSIADKLCPA
jgi:hypothetical protein